MIILDEGIYHICESAKLSKLSEKEQNSLKVLLDEVEKNIKKYSLTNTLKIIDKSILFELEKEIED